MRPAARYVRTVRPPVTTRPQSAQEAFAASVLTHGNLHLALLAVFGVLTESQQDRALQLMGWELVPFPPVPPIEADPARR